ncbi:MAG: hypothetical protein E7170_02720 [Firmicutes bacterium]|nr:hypothetical protein [Bacillota bacterium]
MKNSINITWCYPDILSLHGDRGNIMAFERICKMLDVEVIINRIDNYSDKIDFENTDILFFNPGEFKCIEYIVEALNKQKKELKKYIENNKVLITIGTTGAAFAKTIKRINKDDIDGLGFLDMTCEERDTIHGDDLIVKLYNDMEIAGNQIQVMETILNNENIKFADVIYGYGNNGYEKKQEGAKYKNLIFTNILGPLFVKNPWYAEEIIKIALKNKKMKLDKVIDVENYDIEIKSLEAIKKYNEEK